MTFRGCDISQQIVKSYSLDERSRPVDLASVAKEWGVTTVEQRAIASEAMLLPLDQGYKVILKNVNTPRELSRQRFSFAHELGHLLLMSFDYKAAGQLTAKHRGSGHNDEEERLCDQIAAEILMPRVGFLNDAKRLGWTLRSLGPLAHLYETSIPATATRMVGLFPEPCVMGIWRPAAVNSDRHALQQIAGSTGRFGVPNSIGLARRRMWLVSRASRSIKVESGIAPVLNKARPHAIPMDVPAEGWAWGRDEYRRVILYYYPERDMSDEMSTLARAI